jgi:hypothetical protein
MLARRGDAGALRGPLVDAQNVLFSAGIHAERDQDAVIVEVDPVDHHDAKVERIERLRE